MTEILLDDVPLEKVQDLLNHLLNWNSLDKVKSVHIEPRCVTAEVYAVDSQGHLFVGPDGDAATHVLKRKIR